MQKTIRKKKDIRIELILISSKQFLILLFK